MGPASLRDGTRCICILRPSSPRSLSVACPPLCTVARGLSVLGLAQGKRWADASVLLAICIRSPFCNRLVLATLGGGRCGQDAPRPIVFPCQQAQRWDVLELVPCSQLALEGRDVGSLPLHFLVSERMAVR